MSNKATAEFEIKVSGGRIIQANAMPDGRYQLIVELAEVEEKTLPIVEDGVFVKVKASKLTLEDEFMQYVPQTDEQKAFKELVKTVIQKGVKDFWRPKYDPSLDETGNIICYNVGNLPAVGKSYYWWKTAAKQFKPECKSRLGTRNEYIAFLAVLIKKLVANGWTLSAAWNAVCNNSKELGHYLNSEKAIARFEDTGSREVCGFFDLSNTYKVVEESEPDPGFCLAGGCYKFNSDTLPLADMTNMRNINNVESKYAIGWIVLEEM